MPSAKKKIEKTSIRKYANRQGLDSSWFMQDTIDDPVSRSVVAYMAVRSAHMRGVNDARKDVKARLGLI